MSNSKSSKIAKRWGSVRP